MAALTSLELDDNEIVSFELANYAPLKTLRLSNNRLRNTPTESPHCRSNTRAERSPPCT